MLNRLANARDGSSNSGRRANRSNGGGGPLTMIVKGVAAGIGFASETYQHHKEKKRAAAEADENASSSTPAAAESRAVAGDASANDIATGLENQHISENAPAYTQSESNKLTKEDEAGQDLDEVAWLLDDAQDELAPPPEYSSVVSSSNVVLDNEKSNTPIAGPASQDAEAAPAAEGAKDTVGTDDDDAKASKNEKAAKAGAVAFMARHPLPANAGQHAPLPMPVILPQRRPGERSRGFIRAYAPLLAQVGIDEATFMDFVTELNKATMPSPWINAINVATLAVQHVPEPVTIAVAIASQIATSVTMTAHSRSKTNTFLNHLNAQYFAPLGLVAVVLTWKPSDDTGPVVTQAEFNETLQRASGQTETQVKKGKASRWKNMMQSSHGSVGFEWPESAPLVFPQLDKLAESEESMDAANEAAKKKPNGFQRSMVFASEYMDKRSQAKWAHEHPESGLSNLGAKPEFRSRYADPNHPAASGNLLALLTGGAVGGGGGLLGLRPQGSTSTPTHEGRDVSRQTGRGEARRGGLLGSGVGPATLIQGVKKLMTEGVLYLMIANMPTPEQMAAAQQILNDAPV